MGQATREAVIRLRVEQKLDKPKMPSLAPINKWRDAQIAAQKKVEQHAIASERRIQASLDQTIRKLQQIVALQNQRAAGGGGLGGGGMGGPYRDPKTGRYARRGGGGRAAGIVSGLGALGGVGLLGQFIPPEAETLAREVFARRGQLAGLGRSALGATSLPVLGGLGIVGGTVLGAGAATYGYYEDQNRRAQREGAYLDAVADSRRRQARSVANSQIGTAIAAADGRNATFRRLQRAGNWEGLLRTATGPQRGLSVQDVDAITGRVGVDSGLYAASTAIASREARLAAIRAGRAMAIAESRDTSQLLAGNIGGLQAAIRGRASAQASLQSARDSLAGRQAALLGADPGTITSLRNFSQRGISGSSTEDLYVAHANAQNDSQERAIIAELQRRESERGFSRLLEQGTGIRNDVRVREAEAAVTEAAQGVTSERTRIGYGSGERAQLSDEEVVQDLERRAEQYRREYESAIRAFDATEQTLLDTLRTLKERSEQLQQALEAQAGAA